MLSSETSFPIYFKNLFLDSGLASDLHQPRVVLLSCVPVYTTEFFVMLWGKCELLGKSSPNANRSNFIPGNPKSFMIFRTSGVITAETRARRGRLSKRLTSELKKS